MVIYVIYKGAEIICVTFMPKVVYAQFTQGADCVDLWEKEKLIQRFTSAKQFHRYQNPPREEEDEESGEEYEW